MRNAWWLVIVGGALVGYFVLRVRREAGPPAEHIPERGEVAAPDEVRLAVEPQDKPPTDERSWLGPMLDVTPSRYKVI